MSNLWMFLRFDWPLHLILLLTNWLPDNVLFLKLRGRLVRPFLGRCGSHLNLGRNVTFHNPSLVEVGNYVHISYGCMFSAVTKISIDDEVMFGPYCVVISGDHTLHEGSFRFGEVKSQPIKIMRGSWLGAHVVITAGCCIGEGSLMAAGAVVSHDIEGCTMVGGVPARPIKYLLEDKL